METIPGRENPIITTLDSDKYDFIMNDELKCLSEMFEKYNYEIRVAGGAVRDLLMDIKPKDLDFATVATPQQMKEMFTKENVRMINDKGEKHGTITARINNKENFEITTLRIDVVTDGRFAEVEYTTDWKLDANRRDLTINSMFLDFKGNIYDYFYGYDDLKKRRVVFVGDAATRIKEDFLRILRYFRFYGRIAAEPDKHDEQTLQDIKDNVHGLQNISGERIWTELSKILEGNYSRELMNTMIQCGLAEYIGLPKNADIDNFNRIILRAEKNKVKLLPATMLAALLKDIDEVYKLHMRLKLSAFNRDLLLYIAENRTISPDVNDIKTYQHILLHEIRNKDVKREYIIQNLKYSGHMNTLKEFENWQLPKFPLNGIMIKKYTNENVMIGLVLKRIKNIWMEHKFSLSEKELIDLIPQVIHEIRENTVKK